MQNTLPIQQREDVRQQVIEAAAALFHKKGIRNVTMDDISHKLAMSKRTLYQIFADKEQLLLACVMMHEDEESRFSEKLTQKTKSVLDFILMFSAHKMSDMDCIRPEFYIDLIKYPRVAQHIEMHKKKVEESAIEFMKKGVEEGYFRQDVNFGIVMRQLLYGMDQFLQNRLIEEYSQRELFMNTVIPYIRGCSTHKGIEMIDAFLDKLRNASLRVKTAK